MISSLHIENIAVIKNADVDFSSGFNVLTGETGAGKSILIDSINLLRGVRADKSIIRTGESSACVGALFSVCSDDVRAELSRFDVYPDENDEIYIQRTITVDGKNSIKLNGKSINIALLKQITASLFTIHGQNDNLMLTSDSANLSLLDKYADTDIELTEYKQIYSEHCKIKKELSDLARDEGERIRLVEMLEYQIADIESAKLKDGEEDKLLEKKNKVKNLERISKQLNFAYRALKGSEKGNACYIVERSITALESISDVVPEATSVAEKLEDVFSVLLDAAERIYDLKDDDVDDPDKMLDEIESRLEVIHKLKRKYGADIAAILSYCEDAKIKLEDLNSSDERIAALEKKQKEVYIVLKEKAELLHNKRLSASCELSKRICENLVFLDMPKVEFKIKVDVNKTEKEIVFDKDGMDSVEFLVSTNVGEPALPIAKIASGGELARIMLSIKNVIAEKDFVQTLIFDEIDTGVSGKTARKIGINLLRAGKTAQVICITHSAQIASLADSHLLIQKNELDGRIYTRVEQLDDDGRISELARILGGINITELQMATARELLSEKTRYLEE